MLLRRFAGGLFFEHGVGVGGFGEIGFAFSLTVGRFDGPETAIRPDIGGGFYEWAANLGDPGDVVIQNPRNRALIDAVYAVLAN